MSFSKQMFADFGHRTLEMSVNECQLKPRLPGEEAVMSLVVLLVGMGVLMGAAAHTSLTAFTVAAAAIGLWLAAFAVRERVGRHRG
jgi:protein-S-isoprenylcysteine O-methyltransferase Ste14